MFVPEAFRLTPFTPFFSRSVASVSVGTLVTVGAGVLLPSKIKLSVAAGVARVGFQLVGTCQSVAAPVVPPIQV